MKNELETLKEMRADIDAKIDKLSKPKFKKGDWADLVKPLTIDEIASKLIGLDLEDTKSELIRMKTQIIETLKTISMIYGTLNESDSISPSDDKEKRYTECEYCCGDGWILLEQDENEGKQVRVDCHICHGEGQIEIED